MSTSPGLYEKPNGTGTLERSLSSENWQFETSDASTNTASDKLAGLNKPEEVLLMFTSPRPLSELNDAATTIQKVYKSYRTRRNLADCAVVIEELWWKALDFASRNQRSDSD